MKLFRIVGIAITILIQCWTACAQGIGNPVAGSAAAAGYCSVALKNQWSGFNNQASLAYQREYWVGIHHENRFLLPELGLSTLGLVIPVKPGTFGFDLSHFGFSGFSKTRAGCGYGMLLGKRFTAGVGLAFYRMQLPVDYRSANAYTVEGGIHYMPSSRLTFGFYVYNPTSSSFDDLGDLPTMLGFGIAFSPSAKILLLVQIDDDTQRAPALRGGIEYRAIERAAFRIGYSAVSPEGITAGVGFPINNFNFDVSLIHNQVLGFTPCLSVAYIFTKSQAVSK